MWDITQRSNLGLIDFQRERTERMGEYNQGIIKITYKLERYNSETQKNKFAFLNIDLINILYIEFELYYVIEIVTPLESVKWVTKYWRTDVKENGVTSIET